MIVKPKVRAFLCVTAHPTGCAQHVQEQIQYVKAQSHPEKGPKNVLVIGASTGYGLATRIVSAFGYGANSLGIFFERPSSNGKTASAGWYNSAAFEVEAETAGLGAWSLNGDAFSDEMKIAARDLIREKMGKIDLVVYSLASPRRTDPRSGTTYKSSLKPIGRSYTNKVLDTDKVTVESASLEPATDEEIEATVKVMGGEDWKLWIETLKEDNLLEANVITVAYDYIGPKVTWPIYYHGTIGKAKDHLKATAGEIGEILSPLGGRAIVSVNKAVVTQASSAIPGVNLYITLLFKIMKAKGIHEGVIEQMDRLFRDRLYAPGGVPVDHQGLIRIDDYEMRDDIQEHIGTIWDEVSSSNLKDYADFEGYRQEFLRLFGFEFPGVDYEEDVDVELDIPSLKEK